MQEQGIRLIDKQLLRSKHKETVLQWMERITSPEHYVYDETELLFGKLKIDLDYWYFELTGEFLEYHFAEQYLLTPSEFTIKMLHRNDDFIQVRNRGIDIVEIGTKQYVPKYMLDILHDPVYSKLIEEFVQLKRQRTQSRTDEYFYLAEELALLHLKYKTLQLEEAFAHIEQRQREYHGDYSRWKEILTRLNTLLQPIK